tara:strand:+ start:49 stop:399 length:351 start_codon:yes stop_codon:yes gene_type:complete
MAEYFVVTTKDDHGAYFQTRSTKFTRDITPVGKTTLNNSAHHYHRLPEAAYYVNILANLMYRDWYDFTDELKEKVKKLVGENAFVEYQDFIKMESDELRRLRKEYPEVYGYQWEDK